MGSRESETPRPRHGAGGSPVRGATWSPHPAGSPSPCGDAVQASALLLGAQASPAGGTCSCAHATGVDATWLPRDKVPAAQSAASPCPRGAGTFRRPSSPSRSGVRPSWPTVCSPPAPASTPRDGEVRVRAAVQGTSPTCSPFGAEGPWGAQALQGAVAVTQPWDPGRGGGREQSPLLGCRGPRHEAHTPPRALPAV